MTGKNDNVNYKPMFLLSAMFMGIIGSGFMSKEDAPIQDAPSILQQKGNLKLLDENPVVIAAGDIASIQKIANTVMPGELPALATPQFVSQNGLTSIYQIGDFEFTFENFDLKRSSEQVIFVSVKKNAGFAATKEDVLTLNAMNEESNFVNNAASGEMISTYKLKVSVKDEIKPVITVSQDEDVITEGDDFNAEDYFISAVDNVDGNVKHETVSDVDADVPGEYTITYTAKDRAGNKASASVNVTVEEKEEPVLAGIENNPYASTSGMDVSGNSIASAALAQVGYVQDCTALVSNALAAQGIYFSGWPADYLSLGTVVSAAEAQPGDVLYYANGGTGLAHVAIYLGNGQAVHGGWHGETTVVSSAYVGSGPVFIHIGK
ncbi:MAG: DUF5011 domain-containing protein [Erysipelotrichaceae bacterium]|nr:DUF5011 domain-containing protein [Erysipelotrichaceae bacterium]